MRIFISFFLVLSLVFSNTYAISANYQENNAYEAQKALVETSKYAKYIPELEAMLPKLSQEKLQSIHTRVSTHTSSNADLQNLLSFIEIYTYKLLEKKQVDETQTTLNETEQAEVQAELALLQNTILDAGKELIQWLSMKFDTLSRYKQSGDMSFDLNMHIPDILQYSLGIQLENYVSETQVFDSKTQGNLKISGNVESFKSSVNGDISGNIDMISKDGVIYIKAQNINYNMSEMIQDSYTRVLDTIEELGAKNTYVQYNDASNQAIIEALKTMYTSQGVSQFDTWKQQQLFTSTEKNGSRYEIVPTQAFCSLMKEGMNIFDPFSGKECSDAQYQKMLKNITEWWVHIFLTPGANRLLSFEFDTDNTNWNIDIRYSRYGLISITGDIYEPKKKEVNNISFSYIPKKSLSFHMNLENMFTMNFDSKLNKKNHLLKSTLDLEYAQKGNSIKVLGQYNHGKISVSGKWNIEKVAVDCHLWWNVYQKYGSLQGKCDILGLWWEKMHGSMTSSYDMMSQRNNFDVDVNIWNTTTEIFSFTLKNTGTLQYLEAWEIQAPKKVVPFIELLKIEK